VPVQVKQNRETSNKHVVRMNTVHPRQYALGLWNFLGAIYKELVTRGFYIREFFYYLNLEKCFPMCQQTLQNTRRHTMSRISVLVANYQRGLDATSAY